MLGGVKGDPGAEDIPLFRLLARRWKPVVPLRREGAILLSTRKGAQGERRAWTSKGARSIYANGEIEQKISKRAWNPWLWMK
ncbi:MAG: hypothetical protein WDO17_22835 [Alphaproteobacteria bacterium]